MKARRSMVSHRNTFKYTSPVVSSSNRFTGSGICTAAEDQENIAPVPRIPEDAFSAAKRRKLYNGQAAVEPMDMEMSAVITPKRVDVHSALFTPPNRIPQNGINSGTPTFTTPQRQSSLRPTITTRTIQEVFRNVTVYVEVKTIDEDRSAMIKAVAQQMGAAVNDKLYKNTTHVIFREGSMTTYKKALKWGIPLVSVTWLEECRKTLSLVDPARFLPINLEPYEHPELYKRVRKAAPTNGEVTTTPERFALKPRRPEDDFERDLLEFQQTKLRLEMDSPTSSITLGRTALNFSPIGESTKIGAGSVSVPRTPNGQSNVTPLLRRLMIRNAEEDRRERNCLVTGRENKLPDLEHTKYDRLSMDLSSMWGQEDAEKTNNSTMSMVEETLVVVDDSSPEQSTPPPPPPPVAVAESKTTAIMRALRRQTMHFTQNASLDISPMASATVKENNNPEMGAEVAEVDGVVKVPKICAAGQQRKSLEEDTLREDIVRAKEELLGRAVVINKSDKRRSLLPMAAGAATMASRDEGAASKVNRRRTLFNVNAISEGGLKAPSASEDAVKVAAKRRTLLPTTSQSPGSAQVEVKKSKKASIAGGGGTKMAAMRLGGQSQTQRKGSNMGPPMQIPLVGKAKVSVVTPKRDAPEEGAGGMKRKLFNSVAELSPVSSPKTPQLVQAPRRTQLLSKPVRVDTGQLIKEKEKDVEKGEKEKRPVMKKCRRSSMDFEKPVGGGESVVNSSTATVSSSSHGRGTMSYGGAAGTGRNVLVLTNGQESHLEYMKELVQRLGGNFEVDTRVTSKTTHMVCVKKTRNMNMLRSVIRGIWVLDYDWLVKSSELGQWQREEDFQVNTFGNTLTRVRSERQAFGSQYKMELFCGTGKFHVLEMATVPVHHVKELIMLCGGIVVDKAADAKYVIGDKARPEMSVISPSWLFDCVCQYSFLNHKKYLKK